MIDKDPRENLQKFRNEAEEGERSFIRIKSGKVVKKRERKTENNSVPTKARCKRIDNLADCKITNRFNDKHSKPFSTEAFTDNKLNCFFANARSLVNNLNFEDLQTYASEFNLHIVGIAETWLNENVMDGEICLIDYTAYRKYSQGVKFGRGGGVILY